MKTTILRLVAVSIFVIIMASLSPLAAYSETPQSNSEHSQWVVPIFLPDIAAVPELNTDKWIDLADLPDSDIPESSFQGFRLPHINAIYTWHKSVIESLTANCSIILIDYKEATRTELSALPVEKILAIGICGPQVRIITTSALHSGNNPALISADLMEFVALAKAAGYDKK